jgi:hypothetical protein
MPLTEIAIKALKPVTTARKIADDKGLYLEVMPTGSKYWRFKYRFAGKEKRLAIGVYPEISLKEAREKRDDAKRLIRDGIDPSAKKQEIKQILALNHENNFKALAVEWLEKEKSKWTAKHAATTLKRMENNLFPALGSRPIKEITPAELLTVLKKIEERGAIDVAHRTQQTVGQIYRYDIITGRADRDIAADLRGALKTQKTVSHAY